MLFEYTCIKHIGTDIRILMLCERSLYITVNRVEYDLLHLLHFNS